MNAMSKSRKVVLIERILTIDERMKRVAQQHRESVIEFGERTDNLLAMCNNLCKIAQVELNAINLSCAEREREMIEVFLLGLKKDIKRYICKPEIYRNLTEAREHAQRIELHLRDLAKMKRRSIINM